MSKENIAKFQEELRKSPKLQQKLKDIRTPEDIIAFAKEEGFDFSAEELAAYRREKMITPRENVKLFYEELSKNEALQKQIKPTMSKEELVAAATKAGFVFAVEDLMTYPKAEGKTIVTLSDDQLEKAVGGILGTDGHMIVSPLYSCDNFKHHYWPVICEPVCCQACVYRKDFGQIEECWYPDYQFDQT